MLSIAGIIHLQRKWNENAILALFYIYGESPLVHLDTKFLTGNIRYSHQVSDLEHKTQLEI